MALDLATILEKKSYDHISLIERAVRLGKKIKKEEEEILEKGKNYKIIRIKGEKLPTYVVSIPELDEKDRELLKRIQRRAIGEITIDPETIPKEEKRRKIFIREIINLIKTRFAEVPPIKYNSFAELIVQDMIGYGLLEPLLKDDSLEEVMVIGTNKSVYVYHRKHGMCKTNIIFERDEEIERLITKIARRVGRRIDASQPLLDARLPDGSRVNATIKPVSLEGPTLTIRKFRKDPFTIVDLINFGTLTPEVAAFLWICVDGFGVKPANILVSGGTSSGKTTTLNCLASFIPPTDRVISIEDTAELQLPIEHWIRLETRPPNVEGRGEVSMDMLLKNTLRMRPDRIIVGEVRGEEAKILLAAMNTGQSGCMGTIHANTARETVTRLTNAPMLVPKVMIPSLDLILMQNRFSYKGKTIRRVTEIAEVIGIDAEKVEIELKNIFVWDPKSDKVITTGEKCRLIERIRELRGISKKEFNKELENRRKILEYLFNKRIRDLSQVGEFINEYYVNKEELLSKIEKEKDVKLKKHRKIVKIIEEDKDHKLVLYEGEKNLRYELNVPVLTKNDKKTLKKLEQLAIKEVKFDPYSVDIKGIRKIVRATVLKIIRREALELSFAKQQYFAEEIVNNMIGYGLLEPLLKDDSLEEVMVISHKKPIYVNHREHGTCKTNLIFGEEEELLRIIEKIAASVERRIDKAVPLLDARLPDGSRVNATIKPVSLEGPTLTIRKFRKDPFTIVDLINFGTLNTYVAAFLWVVVEGLGIKPGNILVAGGSSSGKTTTLNCLASFIPPTDRVISIEDTAELQLPIEHWIRLETRPPNVEGRGEVSMDELVKNTLRMRPDRIIVGEVRGEEAKTLFTAMNTGHDGCMGTLHANSANETIIRLTNPPMNVPKIMIPALDLIIMQNKIYKDKGVIRRITEIAEISKSDTNEEITLRILYKWKPGLDDLREVSKHSDIKKRIAGLRGWSLEELEGEIRSREKVLSWMVKNNIKNVHEIINRYYSNNEELLEEIEGQE